MDEMTIFNPVTGKDKYRINKDLQVEDLDGKACHHEFLIGLCCWKCRKTKEEIENES